MRAPSSLADNTRSAVYMTASMAFLNANDALLKTLAGEVPLFQAVFVRGLVVTLLVGTLAWHQGAFRSIVGRHDRRMLTLRTLAEIGGTICFLTALFNMPIANATAIIQSVPLAVTLGAALVFGESVGWRRYLAIAAGFAGVLIIVRPGAEGFNAWSLWAMASIVFIVVRDLGTRGVSRQTPAALVVFITGVAMTVVAGGIAAFGDWVPLDAGQLVRLGLSAFFLVGGYLFGVMTMRTGDIGFVAPFRYTLLIWAIFFGIVVFDEWPDIWMLAGSSIIVAAGLYTFHRERLLARRRVSGIGSR